MISREVREQLIVYRGRRSARDLHLRTADEVSGGDERTACSKTSERVARWLKKIRLAQPQFSLSDAQNDAGIKLCQQQPRRY